MKNQVSGNQIRTLTVDYETKIKHVGKEELQKTAGKEQIYH